MLWHFIQGVRKEYKQLLLLLLLLLSRFSHVWLCATPEMAAQQAPLSLGFSRQEHWSGLPFSSPLHESEKWKGSRCQVWLLATPWTAAYQAPLSMRFSRQEYLSGVPLPSPKQLLLITNNTVFPSKLFNKPENEKVVTSEEFALTSILHTA